MLNLDPKSNLLEMSQYKYSLQDVETPNLYREVYPYSEIPKIPFNYRRVPLNMPDKIWITDTTFRDGQQSRAPYTPEQIAHVYSLLSKLGGPNGLIRQSEFFIYSDKDRKALELCMEQGLEFPEITTWIRASKADFELVRDIGNAMTPLSAFLLNLGLETLHLRMPRHSENALAVARFLRESSRVAWVNYPGLEGDSQYSAAQKYLPNGAAGVVSFGIRGGRGAAVRFLDSLELVALVVHVCDARTSALHPASTTHRQLSDKQLEDCGITPDFIRLSVGIESANDIIADIAQALEKSRVEQRRERHAD